MSGSADRCTAAQAGFLLADASVPVNFCKRGFHRKFSEYTGSRIYVVQDVLDEFERLASSSAVLQELLRTWPPNPAIQLSAEQLVRAGDIVQALRPPGGHPKENFGEVATVVAARDLVRSGEDGLVLLIDDRDGKALAADAMQPIPYVDTRELVLEMVLAGPLSEAQGKLVWQSSTYRSEWPEYKRRLADRGTRR